MRRLAALALGLGALMECGGAGAQPGEWPATVVTISGRAEVQKKGGAAWSPAKLRLEVGGGDRARTAVGSRLVLRSTDEHAVRLAQLSQVELLEDEAGATDRPARVRMERGWLWVAVKPGSPDRSQVEVLAGPVTVALRGTGVGIRMNADGSVLVRAYHGLAVCTGPGSRKEWERQLQDGQEIVVAKDGTPGPAQSLTRDKIDESWIKWNEDQDLAGGYGGKPPADK
jgi:ferric-dicitrate binding protein FerR (iron transport regulator)